MGLNAWVSRLTKVKINVIHVGGTISWVGRSLDRTHNKNDKAGKVPPTIFISSWSARWGTSLFCEAFLDKTD